MLVIAACGPAPRDHGDDDDDNGNDASTATDAKNGCANGTELIYTIDQFNEGRTIVGAGVSTCAPVVIY